MKPQEQAEIILLEFGSKKLATLHVKRVIEALEVFGYDGAMYDDFETGRITTTGEQLPTDYWYDVLKTIDK